MLARKILGLPIVLALFAVGCLPDQGGDEAEAATDEPVSTYNSAEDPFPIVVLETTVGNIVLELDRANAPKTVNNFLTHIERMSFYDGMFFYRNPRSPAVIQAGLLDSTYARRLSPTAFLDNEGDNGLKNLRGTVAMAHAADPNSAKSEFFINVEDNPELDTTEDKWGWAVFGKVIEGMDVVEAIHDLPTRERGRREYMPEEPLPTILQAFVQPKPEGWQADTGEAGH
ncbi:MAG: peptidylprolyl isomerase [Gemmatimonadota bacterium]|nr:MAG: peptidylprolyl isomerase [Gemmatimonadota bacterium]